MQHNNDDKSVVIPNHDLRGISRGEIPTAVSDFHNALQSEEVVSPVKVKIKNNKPNFNFMETEMDLNITQGSNYVERDKAEVIKE